MNWAKARTRRIEEEPPINPCPKKQRGNSGHIMIDPQIGAAPKHETMTEAFKIL
jgi:hypothetical protein